MREAECGEGTLVSECQGETMVRTFTLSMVESKGTVNCTNSEPPSQFTRTFEH